MFSTSKISCLQSLVIISIPLTKICSDIEGYCLTFWCTGARSSRSRKFFDIMRGTYTRSWNQFFDHHRDKKTPRYRVRDHTRPDRGGHFFDSCSDHSICYIYESGCSQTYVLSDGKTSRDRLPNSTNKVELTFGMHLFYHFSCSLLGVSSSAG